MPTKPNSAGKMQSYDKSNGRYEGGAGGAGSTGKSNTQSFGKFKKEIDDDIERSWGPYRDENGNINRNYKQDDGKNEILETGKEMWVKTPQDEKTWESLSDEDKYLLSMSLDMGYDADELNDYPDGRERLAKLEKMFSHKSDNTQGGKNDLYLLADNFKVDRERLNKSLQEYIDHGMDEKEAIQRVKNRLYDETDPLRVGELPW